MESAIFLDRAWFCIWVEINIWAMSHLINTMKSSVFYIGFSLLLALTACGSQETSEAESIETEIGAINPDESSNPTTDPDPTNDIPADGYHNDTTSPEVAELVKNTLRLQFKDDISKDLLQESDRKFIMFEFDLNDDGAKEILVGLIGTYFCGSGGCTQFVLDQKGNVITKFTVSDYPVIIDSDKSHGWRNLIIYSEGKNHLMKFDGEKYPSNPSMQQAIKDKPGIDLPRALDFVNDKYPWFKF